MKASNNVFALLLLSSILLSSCYSVRLIGDGPFDSTEEGEEEVVITKHSIFWGLKTELEFDTLCPSGTFQEVEVRSNLLFSIVNVASLGFWRPVKVRYTCAKKQH